jgi:hypothetical protein
VLLLDGKGVLAAVARRHDGKLEPEKVFVGPA